MPDAHRVIVLPQALADLDNIIEYIKQNSPQNALAVFDRLWQATQSLSEFPARFAMHQNPRDPAKAVRGMPVGSFIVYYRVDEKNLTVRILSIRDGRRRRPRPFK